MPVDPVILQLKAEVDQYQANLTKAQRHTDDKLDAIEKRGAKMGEGLRKGFDLAKGAAIAFAGALVMDKLGQAISQGLEYASSLGEVSQQLGVTTKDLQFYRFAATQVGLSQEEMDQGLQKLTKSLGEAAQGNKKALDTFAALGVSVRDTNGNVRTAGEILPDLADGFARLGSDAERSAVATDLFSRAGYKMLPFLSGGSSGVKELAAAYDKLGIALSEEQIRKADDAADTLAKFKVVMEAKIAGAVSDNIDSVMALANALVYLIDKTGGAIRAWQNWRKEQANRLDQNVIDGWFTSDKDKAAARARIDARNSTSRVVMSGGGGSAAKPGAKRPATGFGAPLNLKTVDPWAGATFGAGKLSPTQKLGGDGGDLFAGALGGKPLLDIGTATAAVAKLAGDLERMAVDLALAEADLTGNIQQRAEAEKRRIDYDAAQEVERINASDTLTQAEKDKAAALQGQIATARKALVDNRAAEDLTRQSLEAREEAVRFELDALEAERDAATHLGERNAIEQRILELQQQEEAARLEAAIAAGQIADASTARAQLSRKQSAERTGLAKGQQGPGAAYLDSLRMDAAELNAAYEDVAASGLRSLNDGLTEAIMGSRSLGDVFKNVANQIIADLIRIAVQQAIIKPLAESLFGGGGGGGGGFSLGSAISTISGVPSGGGGLIGSLFRSILLPGGGIGGGLPGRAGGGYVQGGQMYRVNEAASAGRVEAFVPQGSGTIIPLGQMNGAVGGGGGSVVQHFHLDARGAVMTQDLVNQINSMGQRAAEAGARGGHALAARDMAQMRRPKL